MTTKSTHKAIVVPIKLEPHPNADSLSIVRVNGYQLVARTSDWKDVKFGVHIPPENYVDTNISEFSFLAKEGKPAKQLVKACKLRGVVSQGVLIPAQPNMNEGDDVTDYYKIEHRDFEAEREYLTKKGQQRTVNGPNIPKYDIEAFAKFDKDFQDGEEVWISEKIHGENWRAVYDKNKDEVFVGSRCNWWQRNDNRQNNYWRGYLQYQRDIDNLLRSLPGFTLRGELYGKVKGFNYGLPKDTLKIVFFDLMTPEWEYVSFDIFQKTMVSYNLPIAPTLFVGQLDKQNVINYANGPSILARRNNRDKDPHFREGCVIKPIQERKNESFNRVVGKIIGSDFYER